MRGPGRGVRYAAPDWAGVHGFEVGACLDILGHEAGGACRPEPVGDEPSSLSPLSAEEVWMRAAEAMALGLPSGAGLIRRVRDRCGRAFEPRPEGGPPVTLFSAGDPAPFVCCPYARRIDDMLNIAHEFAHAVQLVASEGRFMPPANREFCAFVGERLFIGHGGADRAALEHAHRRRKHHFAGVLLHRLIAALEEDGSRYTYWWNYPLAFLAAERAVGHAPEEALWGSFRQQASLGDWFGPSCPPGGTVGTRRELPSG